MRYLDVSALLEEFSVSADPRYSTTDLEGVTTPKKWWQQW